MSSQYIYLLYDVEENRNHKVFKICKKYLNHCQNSVFKGEITESNLKNLKSELKKVIDKSNDRITILLFSNKNHVLEEFLGIDESTNIFL